MTAPMDDITDIGGERDALARVALETAYRRAGGLPMLSRTQEGRAAIVNIAIRELAHLTELRNRSSASRSPAAGVEGKAEGLFQSRVGDWMQACFGPEISADPVERGDRLLEEVFELLQSGGYDPARVLALRDYTWNRPAGEPSQESGGVSVTHAAYCLAHGIDMQPAAETELARIWTKVEQIRAKQAAKPTGSALPISAAPSPPSSADHVPGVGNMVQSETRSPERSAPSAAWRGEPTDEMLNAGQERMCQLSSRTNFDDHVQAEVFKAMLAEMPIWKAGSAVAEVVHAAWHLCDDTGDGGTEDQDIPPTAWTDLSAALLALDEVTGRYGHETVNTVRAGLAAVPHPAPVDDGAGNGGAG